MITAAKIQAVLISALAAILIISLAGCGDASSTDVAPPGNIEFTIESGALARQLRGEVTELIPDEIQLVAGQSIVIHNQDQALHYFLSTPVWPGETLTRRFDEPGIYRYSGAFTCSLGSSTSLTVDVRDAGERSR
ncbi:MAG: hypothetical protein R3A46_18200 [Thermomicrobiales bacterium]